MRELPDSSHQCLTLIKYSSQLHLIVCLQKPTSRLLHHPKARQPSRCTTCSTKKQPTYTERPRTQSHERLGKTALGRGPWHFSSIDTHTTHVPFSFCFSVCVCVCLSVVQCLFCTKLNNYSRIIQEWPGLRKSSCVCGAGDQLDGRGGFSMGDSLSLSAIQHSSTICCVVYAMTYKIHSKILCFLIQTANTHRFFTAEQKPNCTFTICVINQDISSAFCSSF